MMMLKMKMGLVLGSTVLIIVICLQDVAIAQGSSSFDLGASAGRWISAADLRFRLSHSSCGYLVKDKASKVNERKSRFLQTLAGRDRREAEAFLNSSEFNAKLQMNQKLIDDSYAKYRAAGADEKSACGLVVGSLILVIEAGETDWIRRNDSSTIGSNSEATLTVEKEYAVRDAEIVNAKKHLVFKRCAVDQSWSGYACTGKPGLYSVREALDYGRHSKYGSWRIPTQDELKDLLDYFSDGYGYQVFSAELYERWFWTSSKASQRAAYRVIQLDGRLDQPWSRNGSSEQIPKASIILVRSF